jgi:hypothetical protein
MKKMVLGMNAWRLPQSEIKVQIATSTRRTPTWSQNSNTIWRGGENFSIWSHNI